MCVDNAVGEIKYGEIPGPSEIARQDRTEDMQIR
jgi:hypothetical protein